jgi:lipoprotein NlpD
MKGFRMSGLIARLGSGLVVGLVGVVLAGCGSKVLNRAPVEDRGTIITRPVSTPGATVPGSALVKPLPGSENADKVGYYTVKPHDTLIRIGLDHGQSAKDIARWNALDDPNRIEVGQVLRVLPPSAGVDTGAVVSRPITSTNVTPLASATVGSADQQTASAAHAGSTPSGPVGALSVEDELGWIWPSSGVVVAGFDELKNKGLDIGGAAGDPVLAAADGRVVYAGAGLRGYGNLIILKHNNTYLTAYAHNQTLLIKEDQSVRKGQKIAEMGSSDADRVKLHFEVRKQGKPVDPTKYLPAR